MTYDGWARIDIGHADYETHKHTFYGLDCTGYYQRTILQCMKSLDRFTRISLMHDTIAHVIIIIKSEESTLPIVVIFVRGCVPEMFVTSYSVIYCIYIPKKRDFVFLIIVQFMMSANSRIRFGLQIVFVCLFITPSHYHHYANLSDDIELTSTVYWCIASKLKAARNLYWMSNMFLWVEIFLFFACYHVFPKRHSQFDYELNEL